MVAVSKVLITPIFRNLRTFETEGDTPEKLEIKSRDLWVAVISAKIYKRQRRKRQSVTAKREKSQTPKVLTAILT